MGVLYFTFYVSCLLWGLPRESHSGFLAFLERVKGVSNNSGMRDKRVVHFSAIIPPKKRLIEKGEKLTNPATAPPDKF